MLPNQMFNAVLSSLRTFDPLSDTLDILIISFVFYQLLQFARKSRAGQLVKGIILILVFYGLAVMLNLKTVTWVLNNVITIGFMAAVVIFQPELRRTLERMGQSTMWANLLVGNRRSDPSLRGAWQSAVVAICDAAEQLSDTRTGALMVLERNNNLDEIIRTGTPMHADVIPEMLGTIFYEGTPLHDGAVVIRDGVHCGGGLRAAAVQQPRDGQGHGHPPPRGPRHERELRRHRRHRQRGDRHHLDGEERRAHPPPGPPEPLQPSEEEIVPPAEDEETNISPLQKLLRKGGALNHAKPE